MPYHLGVFWPLRIFKSVDVEPTDNAGTPILSNTRNAYSSGYSLFNCIDSKMLKIDLLSSKLTTIL